MDFRRAARSCLVAIIVATVAAVAANARAAIYLPAPGKVFTGVGPGDPMIYEGQTLAHPAVVTEYIPWYGTYDWFLARADANHMRAMVSLMPNVGSHEYISTAQIMRGRGDAWLLQLGGALARRGRPTYVRPMAEMNGYWNPYAAFGPSGKPRRQNSTSDFRQAWRRIVLILRGGPVANIDRALRHLGMPPLPTASSALPQAPVAFVWNPQTAGDPNTKANGPQAYYPGAAYVDWVAATTFSKFPNWQGLDSFYRRYAHKPFAFPEWAVWGRDNPGWTRAFFRWVHTHPRVRMVIYYQGYPPSRPFDLNRFKRSRAIIRSDLRSRVFAPLPPEWLPSGG